jgi:hypothetical protein
MTDVRLIWNTPALTSETFDDEVVIVNFDSGKYHSLQGSAARIWQWFGNAPALSAVLERATVSFDGDGREIAAAVAAFVETLRGEGLLVPATADAPSGHAAADTRGVEPFAAPVLNTFSDMQELLLLDPIHEVDAAGWPVAKAPDAN